MLCPQLVAVLNTPRHFDKGFVVVVVCNKLKVNFVLGRALSQHTT